MDSNQRQRKVELKGVNLGALMKRKSKKPSFWRLLESGVIGILEASHLQH